MRQTVTEFIRIRRPAAEVAALATDPHQLAPLLTGLGRFQPATDHQAGRDEWDVFLEVGTLQIGGRVATHKKDARSLSWHSRRGTRHEFSLAVAPDPTDEQASVVTMSLAFEFAGPFLARIAERLGGGIARRHLVASLEQLRHHLEFEAG